MHIVHFRSVSGNLWQEGLARGVKCSDCCRKEDCLNRVILVDRPVVSSTGGWGWRRWWAGGYYSGVFALVRGRAGEQIILATWVKVHLI